MLEKFGRRGAQEEGRIKHENPCIKHGGPTFIDLQGGAEDADGVREVPKAPTKVIEPAERNTASPRFGNSIAAKSAS